MKRLAFSNVLPLLFFLGNTLLAQNIKKAEIPNENSSFGRIGTSFASDYVYMGRTDSLKAPYLTTSIAYYHKSGFFADGSFSYLTSSEENRIDLYTISGGYDYLSLRLNAGGALSTYFFNSESYAVQSTMKGYASAYIGYDFYLFEVYADGAIGISDEMDGFGGLEICRTIFGFADHLIIIPSARINAGSQNYYNEYYSSRSSKVTKGSSFRRGPGSGGNQGSTVTTTALVRVEEVSKFEILDYELSVIFLYKLNGFRFSFKPVYAIPVNAATITVDQTLTFEETLDNVLFWSAGVSYTF